VWVDITKWCLVLRVHVRVLERGREGRRQKKHNSKEGCHVRHGFPVCFSRVGNPIQIAEGQQRDDLCILPFAVEVGLFKTWFEFRLGFPHLFDKNDEIVRLLY
jgi:hypothetical protein